MSVQFVFGGSGAGKTEYLIREALKNAPDDYKKQWLFIVPEQDTLTMQRKVVSHALNCGKGILNIDVLSFHRLAYRVFEALNRGIPRIIDDMGKLMILRDVAETVKGKLLLYGNQLSRPGFLSDLKSQISELYQYRVLPEMLRLAAERSSSLYMKNKLSDLALIYEAFRGYMEAHGYMTEEELLDRLYQYLPESGLLSEAVLLFDGFTGFTPVQLDILEEMMQEAERLLFALDLRRGEERGIYERNSPEALFYLTGQTVKRITERAVRTGTALIPALNLNLYDSVSGEKREAGAPLPRFQKAPMLDRLEKGLYRYLPEAPEQSEWNAKPGQKALTEDLVLWEAADQRSEIEHLVAEIERAVREEGIRYQEIGILLCAPEEYRDLIYRSFTASGIPYFFDDTGSLMDSPYAELLRAAMEVLERNFSFDSVIRYFRALPGRTEEEENEIDLFENFLRERCIRGAARFSEPWQEYESLRQKWILPLLSLREEGNERGATVQRRAAALEELLKRTAARALVAGEAERLRGLGEQNRAEELLRGMDAVEEILFRLKELLGERPVSRGEFRDLLEAGLSEASVRVIPATLDQVIIGDLKRSRFSNPRRFFLVGANSANLPKAEGRQKLLGDRERALFRELEIELAPDQAEDALVQRFYIYRALLNPSEQLIVSYPLRGRSGKGLRPAGLIGQLHALFPALRPRLLRKQAPGIYRREEALRYLAGRLPEYCESLGTEAEKGKGGKTRGAEEQEGEAQEGKVQEKKKEEEEDRFLRFFSILYRDPEYREKAEQLLMAAFTHYGFSALPPELSERLYGRILYGSITRLEQFNRCAYAHFLKYGLRLSERKTYEVQAFDLGNLYHEALERAFREAAEQKKSLTEYSEEDLSELSERCVRETAAEYDNRRMQDSARNQYLVKKISDISRTTLGVLAEQLRRGDFETIALEKSFELVRERLRLSGRIDRVDVCRDGNHLYIKVVDYKSGKTSFDLNRIYEGLQLQLVSYMNVLMTELAILHPEAEVVPAAMFYYHIDDPVLDYEGEQTETQLASLRLKSLRMDGLVNTAPEIVRHMDRDIRKESEVIPVTLKDGEIDERKRSVASTERFLALQGYVEQRLQQDTREIQNGNIAVEPVREDGRYTACSYCPYHSVCRFDPKLEGYHYREAGKRKPEEIWQELCQERTAEGGKKE